MESHRLTTNAAGQIAYNELYIVDHTDLTETTANTAQVLTLRTVKKGTSVEACGIYLITPFQDASDAAFNSTAITIGETDVDRFLTSTELNVNGTEILSKSTANSVDTLPWDFVAADTIDVTFNSMALKSLSDLDTGKVAIFLRVTEKQDLVRGIPTS